MRDNVSLFVRQSSTGAAFKARGRTVDLRSSRPAGIYETIRHGRDASIYPHRGSRRLPDLPLISKTRGFVAPVVRLACEFSKVVNALLNSRLGTHFASGSGNAWRPSDSTVSRCTLMVISEHVRADKARGRTVDLRSDRPPGEYKTIRHDRGVFIAPHRGIQHSLGLPLISKTWRFCATGAA